MADATNPLPPGITVEELIKSCRQEAEWALAAATSPLSLGSPLWKEGMASLGRKFLAAAEVMESQEKAIRRLTAPSL